MTENRSHFLLLSSSDCASVAEIGFMAPKTCLHLSGLMQVLEEVMKEDCGQTNDLQPFMFNMRNCKEHMERNECFCAVQYNTSFDLTACYIICD